MAAGHRTTVVGAHHQGMSFSTLRSRRSRYTFTAHRHAVLRFAFPEAITLWGGRTWERDAHLFWRIRIPIWVALGVGGWLLAGGPGTVLGAAVALLTETLLSYRHPDGLTGPTASRPPGPGTGPSGVREPRRTGPTSGAGSAQITESSPTA